MIINHNISAMNANRILGNTNKKLGKSGEKLSSGYRVNRAGDDAAGLAISEKMRSQVRGLNRAIANANDGISLIQTAEGALQEVHAILQRCNELCVMCASDTLTNDERRMTDDEIQQLKGEIDQIASTTRFNDRYLFPGGGNPNKVAKFAITVDLKNIACEITPIAENGAIAASNGTGTVAGAGYTQLADKIADEYIPNAVTQILNAFPSLAGNIGAETFKMDLEIGYIDGVSNTLAYAQVSSYATGRPASLLIKVDTGDFSDQSLNDAGQVEVLESTLAHELMHSVMQYVFTDEMTGRTGTEFPEWFVEGTAQLTGGGFPTNWNARLEQIAGLLTDENDTSQDTAISNYLNQYTVAGRPYGHGYLAMAYLGQLASGQTTVTGSSIANGVDAIFANILGGDSLYTAISNATGLAINSISDVEAMFNNPSNDMVSFMRQLSYGAKGGGSDGAGSVITGGLADGGDSIIGVGAANSPLYVNANDAKYTGGGVGLPAAQDTLVLQVGAEAGNELDLGLYGVDSDNLGLSTSSVTTRTNASNAIRSFRNAIDRVSTIRSYYGAIQNRMEHKVSNLSNTVENLQSAESRIRDVDMAAEMAEFTKYQISIQAGYAMSAQANTKGQTVLQLLG